MLELRRLSLCLIARNEEDCIGRCLRSVKDVVDEMIVVDTGSTDRTVEICQSLGAVVYSFPWNGSFADARNYGIARATGDWILWLDSDEEVEEKDRYKLRDVLYNDTFHLVNIHLINFYGDKVDRNKTMEVGHQRLFRNHIGFQFVGNIHETLNKPDQVDHDKHLGTVDIKVLHYGYMENVVENKEKIQRNLTMLLKELEDNENAPWIHYHIATEYTRLYQFQKAFEHANMSIVQFLQARLTPPFLLYRLKYSILINTGSWDGAWPGIQRAVALYPDYVDLRFYMGFILFHKNMYKEAIGAFEDCIQLGENNLTYLTLKGLGSYQAWYFIGLSHEKLEQMEDAVVSYLQAVNISNTFTPALDALINIRDQQQVKLESYIQNQFDSDTQQTLLSLIESHTVQSKD